MTFCTIRHFARIFFLLMLSCVSLGSAEEPASWFYLGKVVDDATSAPIAGASLWLLEPPDYSTAPFELNTLTKYAETDAEGAFLYNEPPRVRTQGRTLLAASAPGYAFVMCSTYGPSTNSEDRSIHFDFRLQKGLKVLGKVLNPDGSPAGEVTIFARLDKEDMRDKCITEMAGTPNNSGGSTTRNSQEGFCLETRTMEDGTFEFDGWWPGDMISIVAYQPGFLPAFKEFVEVGKEDIELRLIAGGGAISGKVRQEESAPSYQGLRIRASLVNESSMVPRPENERLIYLLSHYNSVIGSDGGSRLNSMWPGEYHVNVYSIDAGKAGPQFEMLSGNNATKILDLGSGESRTVYFQKAVEKVLDGTAIDADSGAPIEGVMFRTRYLFNANSSPVAVSNSMGKFTMPIARGGLELTYWLPQSEGNYADTPDGVLRLGELKQGEATLSQQFTVARSRGQTFRIVADGPFDPGTLNVEVSSPLVEGSPKVAPDGRFTISAQANSSVRILVTDAKHQYFLGDTVSIPSTVGSSDVILRLERTATISGVVVNEAGEPLPGLMLVVCPPRYRYDMEETAVEGGVDGRFDIVGIIPGEVLLSVRSTSNQLVTEPLPLPLELEPGEMLKDLRVVCEKGATITGTVLDRVTGVPQASEHVSLMVGKDLRTERGFVAETDADGHFTFERVPANSNSYTFRLFRHPYGTEEFVFDSVPTTPIILQEPEPEGLVFTIKDAKTGEVVPVFVASIFEEGKEYNPPRELAAGEYTQKTWSEGRLAINDLKDGFYRILVASQDATGAGKNSTGSLFIGLDGKSKPGTEILLEPGKTFDGRLLANGNDGVTPVPGARVIAMLPGADVYGAELRTDSKLPKWGATSDDQGKFEFNGLFGETYDLLVLPPRQFAPAAFQFDPSMIQPQSENDFKLHPAASLLIRVRGFDGEPLAGATLGVIGGPGIDDHFTPLRNISMTEELITDESGCVLIEGLPPSVFSIHLKDSPVTQSWIVNVGPSQRFEHFIDLTKYIEVTAFFNIKQKSQVSEFNVAFISTRPSQEYYFAELDSSSVARTFLEEGEYIIGLMKNSEICWTSDPIQVKSQGGPIQFRFDVELVPITLELKGLEKIDVSQASIRIVERGNKAKLIRISRQVDNKKEINLELPAGQYEAEVWVDEPIVGIVGSADFDMELGDKKEVPIKLHAPRKPTPPKQDPLGVS